MEELPRIDTDSTSQWTFRENTAVPARLRQGGWSGSIQRRCRQHRNEEARIAGYGES